MVSPKTDLAATLRVWRDRLDPGEVGLPTRSSRRAAGLRREELADLAGLSVDYVVRLEQGRATAPSRLVVASLARALRLTRFERDHLYSLAGLRPPGDRRVSDHISPGVQRLLTRLGDVPVGVFAADWRQLWWNRAWAGLFGDPAAISPEDRSLVLSRFPIEGRVGQVEAWPVISEDLEASNRAVVSDLRRASVRYSEDERLSELLAGLRTAMRNSPRCGRRAPWPSTRPTARPSGTPPSATSMLTVTSCSRATPTSKWSP